MIKGFLNTAMEKDIRLSVKHANITMIFGQRFKNTRAYHTKMMKLLNLEKGRWEMKGLSV